MGLFHKTLRELLKKHLNELKKYMAVPSKFLTPASLEEMEKLDEGILIELIKLHERYLDQPEVFNQLTSALKKLHEKLKKTRGRHVGPLSEEEVKRCQDFIMDIELLASGEVKEVRQQTKADFVRLGINPKFYKPGLTYIFRGGLRGGMYSNTHYARPVILGQTAYIPQRHRYVQLNQKRNLMRPRKPWSRHGCYSRTLVHEVLHDVYYGGGMSRSLRQKYLRILRKLTFKEKKRISWYPPLNLKTDYQFRGWAAELFALLGDMFLMGKMNGVPAELTAFFESIGLKG